MRYTDECSLTCSLFRRFLLCWFSFSFSRVFWHVLRVCTLLIAVSIVSTVHGVGLEDIHP